MWLTVIETRSRIEEELAAWQALRDKHLGQDTRDLGEK